ncbi:MAG: Gfo/Idh/MocA family oxidoreductase [Planctomycetes bacterium]|nr:Gfo/Idh/MocA family oxidoreductase [Planctomycetota bacterium]
MAKSNTVSRRRFLQTTAAASVVMASPASSWARVLGANDRLNMAVIGTGGQGGWHTRDLVGRKDKENLNVTRVCDVYRRKLNEAIGYIGGSESSGTMEYRKILDDRDIDAVIIATPDHWHTKIAIEAMEAGKDVYCEKPLSLTIQQALDCRDAVKRYGKKLQVGPQGTSEDRMWKAQSAINRGAIGQVTWSQGSYCRNSQGGQFNWPIAPDAGPNNAHDADGYVWWDRWLGHKWGLAENIPWNKDHFFRFRKYFAYNGGVATDLLYHRLAPLLLAISGPNGEYPRRVVASGGKYLEKDARDIPDTFMMMVDYPSEHTVVLVSVMTNDVGIPYIIRGRHGTMEFEGHEKVKIKEQRAWWKKFREANTDYVEHKMVTNDKGKQGPEPKPGTASFEIKTESRRDHMGNFLDAIRGEAELHCNVDLGCSTMVAIKMAVESYRQDRVMLWDAENERVITR